MPEYIDQTDRAIVLHGTPKRIVSLVPSQTELLADLNLDAQVVGITRFCVRPSSWSSKQKIGGTKDVKLDIIHHLAPDLIIANKEENVKEQVDQLSSRFPVWISDVKNLLDALDMIRAIGQITDAGAKAEEIISNIKDQFSSELQQLPKRRAAYLIWQQPYMTVGGDTFIHTMMEAAGFENVFGDRTRYPVVTLDNLRDSSAELVLLSSEPFPFKERHAIQLMNDLPGKRAVLVDGEMFSWYGSRLLHAPIYLKQLLSRLDGR